MKRLVLIAAATTLSACGGGGAAPPSAPQPPAGTGAPPSAPPAAPAQPQPPSPPAPPTPPAPPPPSSVTIQTPERRFSPSNVTIGVNGTVTWQAIDDDHEIRFTSAAPPGGSPGEVEEGESVSRTFTAAGAYDFECERHRDKGMRGTIVVQGGATQPPPPSTPPPPAPTPPNGSAVTVTTPNETFSPSTVTIPTGGSVTWQFSQTRHNVTFQGTLPAGGNIPDQESGTSASRTFTAPGTYSYICTRHAGMTGRVVVQ